MNKITIVVLLSILLASVGWYVTQQTEVTQGTETEQNIKTSEDTAAVRTNVLGTWRSTQDEQFIRTFTTNAVTDSYEGEVTSENAWIAFTAENAPATIVFSPEPDTTYIQIQGTETFTFKVARLTPEALELVYMDRGGVLLFERVTQE